MVGEIAKGVVKRTTGIDTDAIKSGIDEAVGLCYDIKLRLPKQKGWSAGI